MSIFVIHSCRSSSRSAREFRRFKLTPQIAAKLKQYIKDNKLERDDLLFVYRPEELAPQAAAQQVEHLGLTEPNAAGQRYRHGTLSAYSAGKCRCQHCKNAYAVYRAERRAAGKDDPRQARQWDRDGHIPRRWFRDQVWRPALAASGLEFKVKMHDLCHAHASSPAAPTSRSSNNASATAASPPPRNTSTPSPTPTKPPSTPSHAHDRVPEVERSQHKAAR
ncbi:hypothetical protein [Microtetraspora sp. NBRC 16547]|uniref:hypothetical protein n=1 Tax=Microtetraspora sp. NBRC 16547 TaxID=3030993 RepID=UPI002554E490|nr:hypothetical protein [Microtetraspora sp. NBRC 16547]